MLLHYAIRIVERNKPINDSSCLSQQNFELLKKNSNKQYDYIVFGNKCEHFADKFIDLTDVVNEFNSQNRSYKCPECLQVYEEVSDFAPHDLQKKIKEEFHPLSEKISVLSGILLAHFKRKDKFWKPLEKLEQKIKQLLTENKDDEFQNASKFCNIVKLDQTIQQRLQKNNQIQFQSLCLLDNVNIIIPVRHKDCKHIEAYDLSSLICYQIDNFRDLKNKQLQQRESNQYLKCKKEGCSSIFPLITDEKLLDCLVIDFEFFKTIKKSYPGNQLYVVSKINNEFILKDFISNCESNRDTFISKYWKKNVQELNQLFTYSEFQKSVLEKMATTMNLELNNKAKEQINSYKHSDCQMLLKDLYDDMVEYPVRCVDESKEKSEEINKLVDESKEKSEEINKLRSLKSLDIRTYIAYVLHKQKFAEVNKKNSEKLKCPICQAEFEKILVKIKFDKDFIYYDAELYSKMQNNIEIIKGNPNKLFKYEGKKYLLEDFKNLWKYTTEDFTSDEKNIENQTIYYESVYCKNYIDAMIRDPLINFKCKKQIRFNFEYFYLKYSESQFQFKNGIKLCKCLEPECGLVTEIEGQIYYDHVWKEAYSKKPLHCNCEYGFSYDLQTKEFRELKKGEYVFKELIPPVVRHFKEEEETLERGLSFKYSSGQMQKMRQQSLMEQK